MKKIGLLTFQWANNYGALLQTYALSKVIQENINCRVEVINFIPNDNKETIKSFVLNRRFKMFRKKCLFITKKVYRNENELKSGNLDYDLFVVGSDQVWNQEITKDKRDVYFFSFLKENQPRISYAASFGVDNWIYSKKDTEILRGYLGKFQAISLREKFGKEICESKLLLPATEVLDPTLLVPNFDILCNHSFFNSNEIVSFKFFKNSDYFKFVLKISDDLKKDVRLLNCVKPLMPFKWSPIISVASLVQKIRCSSFVVTDSFHIMCLAIVYNKEFVVFPSNRNRVGRMRSLLMSLGLNSRLYNSYEEALYEKPWRIPINYDDVKVALNALKEASINFLMENVE